MVPRLLNEGQKEWREQVCRDILEQLETEPNLLKRVVTGDESPRRIFAQGQTFNQHISLQRLMRSVREKRRELWETRSWLHHHDNAPAHNALGIREFLAKNNIGVLEQPPYSPDLAPYDFFLFPKFKEVIKGTRFQDSEAIKTARKLLEGDM